jgi:hypothetical protein
LCKFETLPALNPGYYQRTEEFNCYFVFLFCGGALKDDLSFLLSRFVRFVSTPAVLERFISLEREILQIEESSVQANELSNTNVAGQLEEGIIIRI